jgi:hypothetical protein
MRRAILLAALLAAAAVGVSALTRGGGPSARAAVAQAATKTANAGTSRVSIAVTGAEADPPVDGVIDYEHGRASLTATAPLPSDKEATFTMLVVGTKIYSPLHGAFGSIFPAIKSDKKWLEFDFTRDDTLGTLFIKRLLNPAELVSFLRGASEAEEVGISEVRGTEAHHYRGTLSLERVIEQQPPEVQAQLRADLEEAEVKELPFDVWIGDDGLARRLKMGDWNEASQPPATMDFYDFGIPVDIEPPAADEVLTADELMKLIDGQMGTEGCSGFSDPKTAGNQPRYEHCREWTASHLGGTPAGEANK